MAELLRLAGFSSVALVVPSGLMRERVGVLRQIFQRTGLETAMRIDLAPGSRQELLRLLRRFRNSYDVVSVKCPNQGVATVACRDRRVDVVFFDPNNSKVRFNHSLANLLRGALEFNLVAVLLKEHDSRTFARLSKEAWVAGEHRVNVVVSSGCTSPPMVRAPGQLAALASAIGLSKAQSLSGVSDIPWSIISRNSQRRSQQYVEEGVRILLPKAG
jgi:RNase P/RNase MRP subunit p30